MSAVLDYQHRLRPLKRVEYEQLIDAGAFVDERVELIEGFLIRMSPQKPAHGGVIQKLTKLLFAALGSDEALDIRVQLPLAIGDDSEPEPDLAVVRADPYLESHPSTAHLVIEVAQSSLSIDPRKARLYAQALVTEYWIVDVERRYVEVRIQPDDGEYLQKQTLRGTGLLAPAALPALKLPVDRIFEG